LWLLARLVVVACTIRIGCGLDGKVNECVYIDDHLAIGIVPRHQLHNNSGVDYELIQKSRLDYLKKPLPVSSSKSVTNKCEFTAWGTEVRSDPGTAGALCTRRLELMGLTFLAITRSLAGACDGPGPAAKPNFQCISPADSVTQSQSVPTCGPTQSQSVPTCSAMDDIDMMDMPDMPDTETPQWMTIKGDCMYLDKEEKHCFHQVWRRFQMHVL
jgi:hypothetical protein